MAIWWSKARHLAKACNRVRGQPGPLVSCLCVTENRPAFMPWLLWNFDRQTWRNRELIIVDSSEAPLKLSRRPDVRVIPAPPATPVPVKRNRALAEAAGELLTWFDDDDWQHPDKLRCLVEAMGDGRPFAGSHEGWFVDLGGRRCRRYLGTQYIVFNSGGFARKVAASVPFQTDCRRGSDTYWLRDLYSRHGRGDGVVLRRILFFWLCHGDNLSNPAGDKEFDQDMNALRHRIGTEAWAETDDVLAALRQRLER